jgi:hypothetical protein
MKCVLSLFNTDRIRKKVNTLPNYASIVKALYNQMLMNYCYERENSWMIPKNYNYIENCIKKISLISIDLKFLGINHLRIVLGMPVKLVYDGSTTTRGI